jgi:hypothetical protein
MDTIDLTKKSCRTYDIVEDAINGTNNTNDTMLISEPLRSETQPNRIKLTRLYICKTLWYGDGAGPRQRRHIEIEQLHCIESHKPLTLASRGSGSDCSTEETGMATFTGIHVGAFTSIALYIVISEAASCRVQLTSRPTVSCILQHHKCVSLLAKVFMEALFLWVNLIIFPRSIYLA